jgi:hypothetical protein
MKYQVIEKFTNSWSKEDNSERVVFEADTEVLAYRQALVLQKCITGDPGSPCYTEYLVVPHG